MLPQKVVDRHHRVRYSALTPDEVKRAFGKLSTLDVSLAEAAHTRQDIDLIWGAVLTRFFSLVTYRYGADYLSIGRVQTPTLRLVVERERERLAFVPVPYWEVKADLEARGGERLAAEHAHGRFATAAEAERALAAARVETGHGHRLQGRAALARAAAAIQHHRPHERRLGRRHLAGARHEGGRVALPRRPDQLSTHRQHGVPVVPRPARDPAHPDPPRADRRRRLRPRRSGEAEADARQEAHHRPSADLPGRRAPRAALAATGRASTTSSSRRFLATLLPPP